MMTLGWLNSLAVGAVKVEVVPFTYETKTYLTRTFLEVTIFNMIIVSCTYARCRVLVAAP